MVEGSHFLGEVVDAGVVARDRMTSGNWLSGPAMVTERETTVVIPAGFSATVRTDGSIEVAQDTRKQEAAE